MKTTKQLHKKAKHAVHKAHHKKLVRKKTSHRTLRVFFVTIATLSMGSLTLAIAGTHPTIGVDIETRLQPKPTTIAVTPPGPPPADQVGRGSWYALGLPAPDALTCASTKFPRGTYLSVKNLNNGKVVVCLVNDYGPEAWTHRVIDLSRGSFSQVENLGAGTIPVEIRVVPPPPTGLNLTVPQAFGNFGYRLCNTRFTKRWCEDHRQSEQKL